MLEIKNLKKYYGNNLALQIDYLKLENGTHWIKGANGSGKSTLIKCLAGLLSFFGKISLNGYYLKRSPRNYLSLINYSATEPKYPDFLTGKQLIDFYSDSKGGSRRAIKEISTNFEMNDYLENMPISEYSSGMLKKLSLVLAFLGKPRFILLDEPFITLDVTSSEYLLSLIKQQNEMGISIILTSHFESLPFPAKTIHLQKSILLTNQDNY